MASPYEDQGPGQHPYEYVRQLELASRGFAARYALLGAALSHPFASANMTTSNGAALSTEGRALQFIADGAQAAVADATRELSPMGLAAAEPLRQALVGLGKQYPGDTFLTALKRGTTTLDMAMRALADGSAYVAKSSAVGGHTSASTLRSAESFRGSAVAAFDNVRGGHTVRAALTQLQAAATAAQGQTLTGADRVLTNIQREIDRAPNIASTLDRPRPFQGMSRTVRRVATGSLTEKGEVAKLTTGGSSDPIVGRLAAAAQAAQASVAHGGHERGTSSSTNVVGAASRSDQLLKIGQALGGERVRAEVQLPVGAPSARRGATQNRRAHGLPGL